MSRDPKQPSGPPVTAYAGIGLEFAGAICGFCLLGWWIDRHWQIQNHRGVMICGLLGAIGGLYNLIRQGLAASRQESRSARPPNSGPNKEPRQHGADGPDA